MQRSPAKHQGSKHRSTRMILPEVSGSQTFLAPGSTFYTILMGPIAFSGHGRSRKKYAQYPEKTPKLYLSIFKHDCKLQEVSSLQVNMQLFCKLQEPSSLQSNQKQSLFFKTDSGLEATSMLSLLQTTKNQLLTHQWVCRQCLGTTAIHYQRPNVASQQSGWIYLPENCPDGKCPVADTKTKHGNNQLNTLLRWV